MAGFDFTKKLDLSFVGEAWKDCYLEFLMPSNKQIKDIENTGKDNEKVIEELKKLFVGGQAIRKGEKVEVKVDELHDLPLAILTKCINTISGSIDPK